MTHPRFPMTLSVLAFCAMAAAPAMAAFRFFNPSIADSLPKLISATGMYKNMQTKEIDPGVIYFDVNAPLWTDGAFKQRYIAVPPGTSVLYNDTADRYTYPELTMVIKNFSVDTIVGNPASRILFETRFTGMKMVAGKPKWFLFTYRWRPDQSDADLVLTEGADATVRQYRKGLGAPVSMKKWRFPGRAQCAACHRVQSSEGRVVLAFFTAQLNRPMAGNPAVNQLQHFFDIGLLKTAAATPLPDFAKSPRWARWDDTTATLEHRSRSYIAANCSGCHGDRGIRTNATLTVTADYDYHDMRVRTDLTTKKLIGTFPLDSGAFIVPGKPERSVLLYRQKMRNQADMDFSAERMAMPPLGSFEPDTNAVKLIGDWILSMGATGIGEAFARHMGASRAEARDGKIILPEAWMGGGPGILTLADLRGRMIPLERLDGRTYRIKAKPAPGVHMLLWNGRPAGNLNF